MCMWDATMTVGIRSKLSRLALAVAIGLGLMAPTADAQVTIEEESDGVKEHYIPVASL